MWLFLILRFSLIFAFVFFKSYNLPLWAKRVCRWDTKKANFYESHDLGMSRVIVNFYRDKRKINNNNNIINYNK